jgi:hypothetical protein
MNSKQLQDDLQEAQAAIYRVALSLEAFLLNGIPYGVIQRDIFNGFLENAAGNLLTEVTRLEEQASHAPDRNRSKITGVLKQLRAKCQQLIERVTGLISFRILSPENLRSAVSQLPLLHQDCVRQIQELETYFVTSKPFYQSRPAHAAAVMNAFLNNLEKLFAQETKK